MHILQRRRGGEVAGRLHKTKGAELISLSYTRPFTGMMSGSGRWRWKCGSGRVLRRVWGGQPNEEEEEWEMEMWFG